MRSGKLPHPVSFVAENAWILAATFSLLNLNLENHGRFLLQAAASVN
jgi:hypothetical protein